MEDNSKESDSKDNPTQQNNNLIENETSPQNCSSNSNKDKTETNGATTKKLPNNESNGCDKENSIEIVSHDGIILTTSSGDGYNKNADTEMEVGSPEKQTTRMHDSQKTSEEMKSIIDSTKPTSQNVTLPEDKAPGSSNSSPKLDVLASSGNSKESNIDFKVIYNKKKYDVSLPPDTDIGALKTHLQTVISIPPAMMKVRQLGGTLFKLKEYIRTKINVEELEFVKLP